MTDVDEDCEGIFRDWLFQVGREIRISIIPFVVMNRAQENSRDNHGQVISDL